jgi:hypothetical protein
MHCALTRAKREYWALSPTPTGYQDFLTTQPDWTAADLASVHVPT